MSKERWYNVIRLHSQWGENNPTLCQLLHIHTRHRYPVQGGSEVSIPFHLHWCIIICGYHKASLRPKSKVVHTSYIVRQLVRVRGSEHPSLQSTSWSPLQCTKGTNCRSKRPMGKIANQWEYSVLGLGQLRSLTVDRATGAECKNCPSKVIPKTVAQLIFPFNHVRSTEVSLGRSKTHIKQNA